MPRDRYNAARYEGSDADERRLFYVAMTRARDWLSLSRHAKVTTRSVGASPYWQEHGYLQVDPHMVVVTPPAAKGPDQDAPITISYSEMASFLSCARAYRLRNLIGFQPRLATELGYGKAVHHVLRTIAEGTRESGKVPTKAALRS